MADGVTQSPRIFHEDVAIEKVQALVGRNTILTPAQKRVIFLEGYSPDLYEDSKGTPTTGVGQTGANANRSFLEVFQEKEDNARNAIPEYDALPAYLQQEIAQGFYRGDLSASPETLKHINNGDWDAAAKEFLAHDEYRNQATPSHIKRRMEAISDAFARYSNEIGAEKTTEATHGLATDLMAKQTQVAARNGLSPDARMMGDVLRYG